MGCGWAEEEILKLRGIKTKVIHNAFNGLGCLIKYFQDVLWPKKDLLFFTKLLLFKVQMKTLQTFCSNIDNYQIDNDENEKYLSKA